MEVAGEWGNKESTQALGFCDYADVQGLEDRGASQWANLGPTATKRKEGTGWVVRQ